MIHLYHHDMTTTSANPPPPPQEELATTQEIEENHSAVSSMSMISSSLLLRIPMVDDHFVVGDDVEGREKTHRQTPRSSPSTGETGNHNIAQQLTAWIDHYHSNTNNNNQQQQRPAKSSSSTSESNRSAATATLLEHVTSAECQDDFCYLYHCRRHVHFLLQYISKYCHCHHQGIHIMPYPEHFWDNTQDSSTRDRHHNHSRHPKTRYDRNYILQQQQQHQQQQQNSPSNQNSSMNHNNIPFIEYALEELQHYAAVLQEFIHRGFPAQEHDGNFLSFTWYCPMKYDEDDEGQERHDQDIRHRRENEGREMNNSRFLETHHSLSWECVNVLFNIAILYTYRSSAALESSSNRTTTPTRAQWTKAGQYLQTAATIVRYMRQTFYVVSTTTAAGELPPGLSSSLSNHTSSHHSTNTDANAHIVWYSHSLLLGTSKFLEVLQLHLLAEAQRAAYQTFASTTNLPSQLAAAAPSNQVTHNNNKSNETALPSTTATPTPPKHFVLAKLAAAAAPLYLVVEDLCQGNSKQYDNSSDPSDECDDDDDAAAKEDIISRELYNNDDQLYSPTEHSSSQSGPSTSSTATPLVPQQVSQQQWTSTRIIQEWEDSVRAYGMWMTTLAEYHQSWVHRKRNSSSNSSSRSHTTTEYGMEIARLEGALKFADYCREFCESTSVPSVQLLLPQITQLVEEMEIRFEIAKRENDQHYHDNIPDRDELPEITQVLSVKTDIENIRKFLPSLDPERVTLFSNVLEPDVRTYVDMFRMKAQNVIIQTEQLANRQTEIAREQLAAVNLPHSITTYRQQQTGGGLPDDIWTRIVPLQEHNTVEQFTREVWSIRKRSDTANDVLKQIHAQLIDVLEIDSVFRQTNSQFVGHDVQQIQKIFRPILQTYDQVLASAQASDDLLMKRCDMFDTDPKFRLLKLPKAQLDRLFPPIVLAEDRLDDDSNTYDTQTLRDLLVDLSNLFNHRETIIHTLQEYCKTYDISKELSNRSSNASDGTFQQIVDRALTSLQPLVNDMGMNLEKQRKLLFKIKAENEQFMKMRNHQAQRLIESKVSIKGGPIVKIYDALEEVESFKQHIQQGKDFYDIVIPKLHRLHEQVDDVSGRLANERMEYEKLPRRSQRRSEARDNDIGQSMGEYNRHSSHFDTRNCDDYNERMRMSHYHATQSSRPDITPTAQQNIIERMLHPHTTAATSRHEYVSQPSADAYVDDEKVASLVSMDFDPVKVVAALKQHDNDLELALNDLLAR